MVSLPLFKQKKYQYCHCHKIYYYMDKEDENIRVQLSYFYYWIYQYWYCSHTNLMHFDLVLLLFSIFNFLLLVLRWLHISFFIWYLRYCYRIRSNFHDMFFVLFSFVLFFLFSFNLWVKGIFNIKFHKNNIAYSFKLKKNRIE